MFPSPVRFGKSYGAFDTNAVKTLNDAKTAGVKKSDVYLFPCPGKDPAAQVNGVIKGLGDATWDFLWLDIEDNPSTGCGWSATDFGKNCAFMTSMIHAAAGQGVGIYSSHYMWAKIMGADCTTAASLPLWYAAYDGVDSCADFKPFGGWNHAFAHQRNDTDAGVIAQCKLSADLNKMC